MKKLDEELLNVMLKYASKEILTRIADKYPEPEEINWKYGYSIKFRKNMQKLIRKQRRLTVMYKNVSKWYNLRKISVYASYLLLIFVFSSFTVFAIPPVRIALTKYIIEKNEKFFDIKLIKEEIASEKANRRVNNLEIIPYIPEGYEIEKVVEGDIILYVLLENSEGDKIIFERHKGSASITVDSEGSTFEEIFLRDNKIYYFFKNGKHTLIFKDKEFGYIISAKINKEELLKIVDMVLK